LIRAFWAIGRSEIWLSRVFLPIWWSCVKNLAVVFVTFASNDLSGFEFLSVASFARQLATSSPWIP
jgi:hypothetical protein